VGHRSPARAHGRGRRRARVTRRAVTSPSTGAGCETEMVRMVADGVGFVGMRSARWEETAELFREVIGANVSRRTADMVGFEFTDGRILELHGPGDDFHSFFSTAPSWAFVSTISTRPGHGCAPPTSVSSATRNSAFRYLVAAFPLLGRNNRREHRTRQSGAGRAWSLGRVVHEAVCAPTPSARVRLCSRCTVVAGVHREPVRRQ
jgi:hypothetical protein